MPTMKQAAMKTAAVVAIALSLSVPISSKTPFVEGPRQREIKLIPSDNGAQPNLLSTNLDGESAARLDRAISWKHADARDPRSLADAVYSMFPLRKRSTAERLDSMIEYSDSHKGRYFEVLEPRSAFEKNSRCLERSIFLDAAMLKHGHKSFIVLMEPTERFKGSPLKREPHAFVINEGVIYDAERHITETDLKRYLLGVLGHGDFRISIFSPIPYESGMASLLMNEAKLKKDAKAGIIMKVAKNPPLDSVMDLLSQNVRVQIELGL